MGPTGDPGPSCPSGPHGVTGWAGADAVSAVLVRVELRLNVNGEQRISTTEEMLYIDKAGDEIGLRLAAGGRVFIRLADLTALLS